MFCDTLGDFTLFSIQITWKRNFFRISYYPQNTFNKKTKQWLKKLGSLMLQRWNWSPWISLLLHVVDPNGSFPCQVQGLHTKPATVLTVPSLGSTVSPGYPPTYLYGVATPKSCVLSSCVTPLMKQHPVLEDLFQHFQASYSCSVDPGPQHDTIHPMSCTCKSLFGKTPSSQACFSSNTALTKITSRMKTVLLKVINCISS